MRITRILHKLSTYCWKNGADRIAQCRIATNLQLVKKAVPAKHSKVTCNELMYASMYHFTQAYKCVHMITRVSYGVQINPTASLTLCLLYLQIIIQRMLKHPTTMIVLSFFSYICISFALFIFKMF